MLIWLRRFVAVLALTFWLGGFTFYGAVVIPIGRGVFGSAFGQVTSPVTTALNIAGALTLAVLAWDGLQCRDRVVWRRRGRWLTWLAALVTLAALFGLHAWLDQMMAAGADSLGDTVFYTVHRAYLWTGAAQWLAAVIHAGLLLASWRDEDRRPAPSPPGPAAPPD